MIATVVHPDHSAAVEALQTWRCDWREATLGDCPGRDIFDSPNGSSDDEAGSNSPLNESYAEFDLLMARFGHRLIELGELVWAIQHDPLKKDPRSGRESDDELTGVSLGVTWVWDVGLELG